MQVRKSVITTGNLRMSYMADTILSLLREERNDRLIHPSSEGILQNTGKLMYSFPKNLLKMEFRRIMI